MTRTRPIGRRGTAKNLYLPNEVLSEAEKLALRERHSLSEIVSALLLQELKASGVAVDLERSPYQPKSEPKKK